MQMTTKPPQRQSLWMHTEELIKSATIQSKQVKEVQGVFFFLPCTIVACWRKINNMKDLSVLWEYSLWMLFYWIWREGICEDGYWTREQSIMFSLETGVWKGHGKCLFAWAPQIKQPENIRAQICPAYNGCITWRKASGLGKSMKE